VTIDSDDSPPLAYALTLKAGVKPHAPVINTIADAAAFLHEDVSADAHKLHWRVASVAIDHATRSPDPERIQHATEAMRNALETDGLMTASARPNSAPGKQKTASDLADMIRKEINVPGIHVAVHEDPAFGWHPTVMSPPAQTGALQELAEAIAKVLRAQYDLKK
jgi:hypothetical protein